MPDVESDGAPHSAEQLNFARGKSAKAGSVISGFVIPEARIHRAHVNKPAREQLVGSAHPEACVLCDTVDYAVLAERIAVALKQSKCRMLERAAAIVLETCLNDKRIVAAEVEIEKRGSLPGLGAAKVRMSNK